MLFGVDFEVDSSRDRDCHVLLVWKEMAQLWRERTTTFGTVTLVRTIT